VNRLATSILLGLRLRRWIEFEDFNESVSELAYLLQNTQALGPDDIAREVCELLFRCDGIGEVWCDDDLIVAYVAQRMRKEAN
jgi:hypothetical protein